jgi:hypothetical protein
MNRKFEFFRTRRGITPDLGVRACVRTLSPPNPDIFTAIRKDPKNLFMSML